MDQVASAVHMWQGRLVKPAGVLDSKVDVTNKHRDAGNAARLAQNPKTASVERTSTGDEEEKAATDDRDVKLISTNA